MRWADWWILFRDAGLEWVEDKVPRLGAALAFYSTLSLAPLLLIVLAIAGAIFGEEAARGQILGQMDGLIGTQGAEAIEGMIAGARSPGGSLFASIIGVVTLLFAASGVFGELQDAMNTIWEVQPKPGRGLWGIVRDRFFSFAMVIGVGFLLLISMILSAALSALGDYFVGLAPGAEFAMQFVNAIVSFGAITGLFAATFKVLPDVEMAWRDVWIGAFLTAALFVIGKYLIGLYLGQGTLGSTYGAAGSIVALLLWIYYSTQILFFGAEITQVYANRFGSRIVPARNAVPVTEEARAQQGLTRLSEQQRNPTNSKSTAKSKTSTKRPAKKKSSTSRSKTTRRQKTNRPKSRKTS